MWLANFEDGSAVSSKQTYWTDLPKDKKLTALQLLHPRFPSLFLNLSGLDKYYFVTEAMAFLNDAGRNPTVVAEIIGGIDLVLGICVEVKLDYSGSVKIRHFPASNYKYTAEILLPGKRDGFKKAESA